MGPVHLYLAAWVAGGVLLGASMLLDGRDREAADEPAPSTDGTERTPPPSDSFALPGGNPALQRPRRLALVRARSVLPLGLVGFGLSGLTAKGLDIDRWPWSFLCALAVGVALIALGYRLSRPRPAAAADQQTKSA